MPEDPDTGVEIPLRRATDHRVKKRFILIPIGVLIVTVLGFSVLKTSDKKPIATETKATASLEIDKPAVTVPAEKKVLAERATNEKTTTTTTTEAHVETSGKGTHFQLSLDVLKERENFKAQQQRWYAQMMFSGIMALASLYVILSKKYPGDVDKWAYSTIAFIMGFWLKGL